jgi:hypothetical protein
MNSRLKELIIVLAPVVIGLLFGVLQIIFPVVSVVTRAVIDFVMYVFWIFMLILIVVVIIRAKRLNQPQKDE